MTTIEDVRQRADAMQQALLNYSEMTYLDPGFQEASDILDIARFRCAADVLTLLAHVDTQAERVRSLEAALRDTSALLEKHCELEPNWNGQEFSIPFAVRLRLDENADALAANADAGNGGA